MKLTAAQKHALVIVAGAFLVIFGADALRARLYPPQPVDFSALQAVFQERHETITHRLNHIPNTVVSEKPPSRNSVSSATAVAAADTLTEKIYINKATLDQLQRLPRIGPAIAARILRYRTEHGPFLTVDDLKNIRGIGPKTLENIRPLVVVKP